MTNIMEKLRAWNNRRISRRLNEDTDDFDARMLVCALAFFALVFIGTTIAGALS